MLLTARSLRFASSGRGSNCPSIRAAPSFALVATAHRRRQTLHADSHRRGNPFIKLDEIPTSDIAIRRLCARAGNGTVFADLTEPQQIPYKLTETLFSLSYDRFWTIMVTPTPEAALECFGGMAQLEVHVTCKLGFPRAGWQLASGEASFTKR